MGDRSRRWLLPILLLGVVAPSALPGAPGDPDAFLDDDRDGVWVGSITVRTPEGPVHRPLLLNLNLAAGGVRGVALAPDSLTEAPTAIEAFELLDATVKRKKMTFSLVAAADESALPPLARTGATHDFTLRLRRGALKGFMKSGADGITGRSRVQLVPLDADEPLRHLWTGELVTGDGTTLPVAIFLAGDPLSGVGLIGGLAGAASAVETATGLEVTVAAAEGEVRFELDPDGSALVGPASGAVEGTVTLHPGGVAARPRLRKVGPDELASGGSTSATIRGAKLPPGAMLLFDHPDAWASPPMPDAKGRRAETRITLTDELAAGEELRAALLAPDGTMVELRRSLTVVEGDGGAVSFVLDLQPIFLERCAVSGCHVEPRDDDPAYDDGATAAGNLELTRAAAYSSLVNVPSWQVPSLFRVEPGNPADSYLVRKLKGEGHEGARMPFGGPYLSEDTIAMFVAWIEQGAPNGR